MSVANVKQGWREFVCDECNHRFSLPCRFWKAKASVPCPNLVESFYRGEALMEPCGEWCRSTGGRPDPNLVVDKFGKLV